MSSAESFDQTVAGEAAPAPSAERATVWVFHGDRARHAAGIFHDIEQGLRWARRHLVSGVLAEYPVGDGCYDIAIQGEKFRPSKPHHGTPDHVARFGPGGQHIHIIDGEPQS
jgi:hypothetical protein